MRNASHVLLVVSLTLIVVSASRIYSLKYSNAESITAEEQTQKNIQEFGPVLGKLQRGDLVIRQIGEQKEVLAFIFFMNNGGQFAGGRSGMMPTYQFNDHFRESIIQIIKHDPDDVEYREWAVRYVECVTRLDKIQE